MKKRVISILMVGTLAMGLITGCGSRENAQSDRKQNIFRGEGYVVCIGGTVNNRCRN